jgi:hypothetical protein
MERRGRGSPLWIGTLVAALAVGVAGGGEPCRAADGPRTACITLPSDEFSQKAAAVLGHLVRENFRRAGEFDLIDTRELLNKGTQDPRLDTIDNAHRLLARGKKQYDNLELDPAIEALSKARELFRKAAGRLGDGEKYVETLLFLGASHILSGDSELGSDAFRQVALFDKRRTLDPKLFPPSMIDIFKRVKSEVAASPVGMVQLKSNPPAADVYLNGVYKGVTPLTLAKVPEGTHFVRLEKDGYLPWGQLVDFFATHEERVEATLQASAGLDQFKKRSAKLLGDLDDDPPKAAVVQFGQWLGVDRLVVLQVKQRGSDVTAEALLARIEPPAKLAHRSAKFVFTNANFLARADAFFTSLYRQVELPPAGGGEADEGKGPALTVAQCNSDSDCAIGEICDRASGTCIPEGPRGDAIYEKWWFWTIVGGVAVVGAGTGVLTWYLLQPEQGAIEFTF